MIAIIAALTIAMTFASLTYAELAPPADYTPPENAKACTDAGGVPNIGPKGEYGGCTYHTPLPNEGAESMRSCTRKDNGEGGVSVECDCNQCHHEADNDPALVGRPDDWPTKEMPAHYVSDPNRQKI